MRRFSVDYLTCHNLAQIPEIMDPSYRLVIAGVVFDGRDEAYKPAAIEQLSEFPGLVVTAHDVVFSPDAIALRFTEHGASRKYQRRSAAWGGITIFSIKGGRIFRGWSEEDYLARKRQLKTGQADPVKAPHNAPWDQPCVAPDDATHALVSTWLEDPEALIGCKALDEIIHDGPLFADVMEPQSVRCNALFTAGPRASFHVEYSGAYKGGFDNPGRGLRGAPVTMGVAGIVDVEGGAIAKAQIAMDSLGLSRRLLGGGG